MSESCIFCKLAAGEIPSFTVYEDVFFRAILDISPAVKGHVLVISKPHATDLIEADELILSNALSVVQKIAAAVKTSLQCDGINVLQNNGTAAGQTVFHLHFHVIPRFKQDELVIPWDKLSYLEGEAEAIAEKIKSCIS